MSKKIRVALLAIPIQFDGYDIHLKIPEGWTPDEVDLRNKTLQWLETPPNYCKDYIVVQCYKPKQ